MEKEGGEQSVREKEKERESEILQPSLPSIVFRRYPLAATLTARPRYHPSLRRPL